MTPLCSAWQGWPKADTVLPLWQQQRQQHPDAALYWLVCSDQAPAWLASVTSDAEPWQHAWAQWCRAGQQQAVLTLPQALPGLTLIWIRHPAAGAGYQNHLASANWQTAPLPLPAAAAIRPWLTLPPPLPVNRVAVIGGGIAGAATAAALARHRIPVLLLEQVTLAAAASGNRQGLLYAKISAHPTSQTELLLAGYPYSRALLAATLPEGNGWAGCGVLHLDHSAAEQGRNRQLAAQAPDSALYRAVDADTASRLAGIPLSQGGLWWPQGAWIHPPAWVAALLAQPLIEIREQTRLADIRRHTDGWVLDCWQHGQRQQHAVSHVVLCAGAGSSQLPLLRGWPLHGIRGQTSVARAGALARQLRCALSAASYLAPAWQAYSCFGASFVPGDHRDDWRAKEHAANRAALAQLHPALAADLAEDAEPPGHAAVRCDCFDHLPLAGPLGDAAAMRRCYAALAHDKNRIIDTDCPWLPGIFVNTAHGSRGLATAPLCAEAVAAALLGHPPPWSATLQQALHPNRLVIRSLTHHLPWPDAGSKVPPNPSD